MSDVKRLNSKAKGNRVELKISKILSDHFGVKFMRTPQSGAIFGASNVYRKEGVSQSTVDTLTGDIICPDNFTFCIEVKSRAEFNFWSFFNERSELLIDWIPQVLQEAMNSNKNPLLIVVVNHKEPFVIYRGSGRFKFGDWSIDLLKNFLVNKEIKFFTWQTNNNLI